MDERSVGENSLSAAYSCCEKLTLVPGFVLTLSSLKGVSMAHKVLRSSTYKTSGLE